MTKMVSDEDLELMAEAQLESLKRYSENSMKILRVAFVIAGIFIAIAGIAVDAQMKIENFSLSTFFSFYGLSVLLWVFTILWSTALFASSELLINVLNRRHIEDTDGVMSNLVEDIEELLTHMGTAQVLSVMAMVGSFLFFAYAITEPADGEQISQVIILSIFLAYLLLVILMAVLYRYWLNFITRIEIQP